MNWREYQSRQRVMELGERFLSYVDVGAGGGEPVVLIHGIPTWGYLWHRQLEALAAHHRVLIPDLLGFGYSDRSDRFDRSIAVQAEALDAWLAGLGVEKASLVAHDIGGGVALRLATLFPHRVARLCVMNAVCYDSWPIELMLQFGHPEADRKLSAGNALWVLHQGLKQGFARSPDNALMAGLLSPYATEVGKLSLIRDAAALNTNLTMELTPRLPDIGVPTLILWGEEDRFQVIRYAERLAGDIPGAEMVSIAEARHFVMLDQPELVGARVREFLG